MNEAPKPVMVWYVVEGLTVMTWLCELDPGANVAPVCGASSWLWLVVVSVTETAGPDAARAGPELTAASPAVMSAAAPSDAVMRLMRDMVLLDLPGAKRARSRPALAGTVSDVQAVPPL